MSKLSPEPIQPSRIPLTGGFDSLRKMERLLRELRQAQVEPSENSIIAKAQSLCSGVATTAAEVFGAGTPEAERISRSCSGAFELFKGTAIELQLRAFERGRARTMGLVEAEIDRLRERVGGTPAGSTPAARRDHAELDLHPDIEEAAGELFRSGHHVNAMEDAVKALNALVRYRSKLDLDGPALIRKAFSVSDPILRFNDLADESDLNEQKAFIMMLSGALAGLKVPRPPRILRGDPELTLEFIRFVSFLAKLVEAAKRE
jgi:uncharacterized protein (TIGR02391 family)